MALTGRAEFELEQLCGKIYTANKGLLRIWNLNTSAMAKYILRTRVIASEFVT